MDTARAFEALGISLGLGLLVGLQRQRAESKVAGLRTFALITVLGTLTALAAVPNAVAEAAAPTSWVPGGWILVAAGLLGVVAFTAAVNILNARHIPPGDTAGITTEIAILVMYIVGVMLAAGDRRIAIAVGGGVAVLLQAKPILHGVAMRMGERDFKAIMQFALIWLVVLPVLPDKAYGPYGVLNPHDIWLMVVLIVGISLGGYVAYRLLGQRAGLVLAGLAGGLVSSTATTVSFARRTREPGPDMAPVQAAGPVLVVMLASTVVFARVLAEIAVVAPGHFEHLAAPIAVMGLGAAVLSTLVWLRVRRLQSELPEQENPTELKGAVMFAGLYAIVLLGVAAAQENLGDAGIFAIAAISGLTDMDAITLSVSGLVRDGRIDGDTAWRAILVAAMSNLVFKGAIVGAVGAPAMLKRIAVLFVALLGCGGAIILLWPGSA
jgi:uncharacterized membrane protein (DUF4010 family)